MKKYVSCFLFFFFLTSASLITLFLMTAGEEARGTEAFEAACKGSRKEYKLCDSDQRTELQPDEA